MISLPRGSASGVRRPQLRHASYREDGHIAFAADRSDADVALPQGESAVLTHLVSAAVEAGQVLLICGRVTVEGALGIPDLDFLDVPFVPLQTTTDLQPSGVVTVRYRLGGHAVRFRTRMTWRDAGWRLALPRVIETPSRRLSPRHDISGHWTVGLRRTGPLGGDTLPVVDAAAGGLGFRLPLERAMGLEGRVLSGTLDDASGFRLPVQVRVRYVRPVEDAAGDVMVGTAFHGFGFQNQRRLAFAIQRASSRGVVPAPDAGLAG